MTNIKCKFDSLFFSLYTPEEVRKLSVKEITSSVSIEPTLGKGSINGLYDPKMGPLNEREPCRTCNLSFYECNGHFGHIELPKPIYNPVLFGVLFKFIKGMCFYCHKLLDIQGLQELLYTLGMKELEDRVSRFNDIDELKSMCHNELIDRLVKCISQSKKSSKCIHCSKPILLFKKSRSAEILVHVIIKMQNKTDEPLSKKIKLDGFDINKPILSNYESTYTTKELYGGFDKEDVVLLPELLREHLRFLWVNEYDKLKMVLPFLNNSNFKYPTDMFFMENILVNPPMNRVPAIMKGDKMTESPETANLALIINACSALSNLINNRMDNTSDYQYFQNNREGVFELQRRVNICLDATPYKNMNNAQPGLRQKLDKKAGLIRTNINAKRVNSACRSVISPDPEIGLDEVGVPVVFLKKLTFAENMNDLNKEYLRQCIINGPEIYPGATSYQVGDKPLTNIKGNTEITADHLESLMQRGETVVVYRHAMNGDTLIMNRQPTLHKNSMQAHKILAILDESAKTLRMNYSNCKAYNADFDGDEMNGHYMQSIISQTDAKIIANVANQHSTSKDGSPLAGLIQDHVIAGTRLCMRNTFLERHEYFDLVKFGLKDNYTSPMTILPPAIIKPKRLWTGKQVLSTILLNSIPTGYSLPNIVLHEPKKNILWKISKDEEELKLSDVDLVIVDGYICTGIFDKVHIGPSQKGLCTDLRELYGNEKALLILTNLSRCLNRYLIYTGFSTNLKDGCLNPEAESIRQRITNQMKNVGLTSIIKTFNTNHRNINLDGIVKLMEKAHFDKSDEFNTKMSEMDMNFKCLSNKYMNELALLSKDSLKENFPFNNLLFMANTGAKGGDSNVKKIAVALGAIEIAGQRTPLTLSGKTLPSFVRYDFNPSSRGFCMSRFTSGLKPQELFFESMAGRDGLVDTAVKTSSSGYLQRCLIKSLEDISVRYDGTVRDNMDKIIQFKYGYDGLDVVKSLTMSSVSTMEVICRNLSHFKNKYLSHKKPITIDENTLRKTDRKNIEELIEIMKGEQIHLSKKDEALLNDIVAVKILSSQCEAGEAVGILAAQSIGEPSTQMTLNTFHNVGQSEMNVTLGIPRLREVLMTGSENIKTPSMSVPILDSGLSMDKLLKQFNKLRLKDIIELPLKLKVNANDMKITFNLKKASEFKHLTHLSVHQAVLKIEIIFFKILAKTLKKIIESSSIDIKEGKNRDNIDEGGKNDESDNEEPVFDSVVEKIGAKEENIDGEVDDGSDSESSDLDDDEKVSETENKDEDNDMDVVDVNISSLELRKNNVISLSPNFINYEVDQINKPTWIRLTIKKINNKMDFNSILLNLINNTLLSETPGVDKAIIMKTKKGDVFCTEGYNNLEVYKHDKLFDLNKFHTNNIVKMSKIYGIEAAISCLIHEMKSVFEPYSIDISSRHMRLIAEYMTFPGHCSAFNRHSMKYHSSQFQRATFETALDSINDMLFKGSVDFLKSPSSNMLLGQVASYLGSNAMDLHYKKSL